MDVHAYSLTPTCQSLLQVGRIAAARLAVAATQAESALEQLATYMDTLMVRCHSLTDPEPDTRHAPRLQLGALRIFQTTSLALLLLWCSCAARRVADDGSSGWPSGLQPHPNPTAHQVVWGLAAILAASSSAPRH